MEILALDVGAKRVGVARASTEARLPQPLMTVKTPELVQQLQKLIKEKEVQAVVVGLPRNLAGQDTDQTRWIRDFVGRLKNWVDIPIYWQDETLTTVKAKSLKPKAKSPDVDAEAAAIILDDFLKTDKKDRVLV